MAATKNNIKSVTETTIIEDGDGNPLKEIITSIKKMDERSNIIYEANWQINGMLEDKTEYTLDEKDRVIIKKVYLDDETVSEEWKYTYDEAGKLKQRIVQYSDGAKSNFQKSTGDNGDSIWTITDEDGELEGKQIITFEEPDLVASTTDIDDMNTETLKVEMVYFEDNLLAERTIYEYGEVLHKEEYEYNDNDELSSLTTLTPKGNLISKVDYAYNNKNQIAHVDNGDVRTSFTYDEKGREIEINRINTDSNLNLAITKRSYNEAGFILEMSVYEMGAQYETEPGVMGRGSAIHQKIKYTYEFFKQEAHG